jgi:hypothetical protein
MYSIVWQRWSMDQRHTGDLNVNLSNQDNATQLFPTCIVRRTNHVMCMTSWDRNLAECLVCNQSVAKLTTIPACYHIMLLHSTFGGSCRGLPTGLRDGTVDAGASQSGQIAITERDLIEPENGGTASKAIVVWSSGRYHGHWQRQTGL